MRRPLPTIKPKQVLQKIRGVISGYLLEHQGTALTAGIIVCNAAGISVTYKNSPAIHGIISTTRQALRDPDLSEEDRKKIQKEAMLELTKLVSPIIIFFAGSTACAIINQKKNEAMITTLTAALTVAQNTISEYNVFKEEVRKDVGEEKYREIQQEIADDVADRAVAKALPTVNPKEELFYFDYLGIFFSSTVDRVKAAMNNVNGILRRNGIAGESYGHATHRGNEIVTYADICCELGVPNEDIPQFAEESYFEGGEEIDWYIGTTDKYGSAIHSLLISSRPSNLV